MTRTRQVDAPRPYGPPCVCGHLESEHIYGEGACRPGFVCPCPSFHDAATARRNAVDVTSFGPACTCEHLESQHAYATPDNDRLGSAFQRRCWQCACCDFDAKPVTAPDNERGTMTDDDPKAAALAAEQEREACRLALAAAKYRMELLDLEADVLRRSEHIRAVNDSHNTIIELRKTLKPIPAAVTHAEALRCIETPIYNTLAHLIEAQNVDREKLERMRARWEQHVSGASIIGSGEAAHRDRVAAEAVAAQVPA